MTSLVRCTRRSAALIGTLGLVGAFVAGCGGGSASSSSSKPSSSSSAGTPSRYGSSNSGGSSSGSSSSAIPQGANAGDADNDNHGGPSDGDGNV